MASRPSRSSSIPIPRSSSTTLPSLGDVINMPLNASPPPLPRPRLASTSPSYSLAMSPPLPRATSRSYTSSGTILPPVLPRIIRANNNSSSTTATASWADVACTPPSSTSPTRVRRPSTGVISLRPPSHRAPSHTHPGPILPNFTQQPAPAPFPRPAYLEHSALRHLLQTELPPHLPPSRYAQPSPSVWPPPVRAERSVGTPSTDSDEDSNASPPPPSRAPVQAAATRSAADSVAMVGNNPVFRLPTRWSEQDRHAYLSVSADGRELTYNGGGFQSGGTVDNAGMARTNHPIPPACGIYYYEIEVLSKGQKAHVSIGFTASDTRLNKLPGWEKNSWGYHGDDGFSFSAEKAGSTYGPTFGGGDIIGAGVDFSQNRAFFTKNGTLIGMVFGNVASDVQIYPSVGLRHPNEGVRVNFGHTAFKYDIDDHVQQQRDVVWSRIQQARVDWRVLEPGRTAAASISSAFTAGSAFSSGDGNESHDIDESLVADTKVDDEGREEVGRLVLNYLVHHGYAKTANAFEEQLARSARTRTSDDLSPPLPVPPPPAPADGDSPMAAPASEPEPEPEPSALEQRLSVVHAVRRGDMDSALSSAETLFPAILERDAGLVRIKLRCRKFVELVNAAAELKRAATGTADGHGGDDADVEAMDVDEGAGASPPPAKSAAEAALRAAIAYGKALRADYKRDPRAEVQAHLEKTFSVVAYHFPMDVGGEVGRWAGQDARDLLAAEVNQAILESQGFPARPALERVYRQTAASLVQLGFLGVGAAVFADIKRELLDG